MAGMIALRGFQVPATLLDECRKITIRSNSNGWDIVKPDKDDEFRVAPGKNKEFSVRTSNSDPKIFVAAIPADNTVDLQILEEA